MKTFLSKVLPILTAVTLSASALGTMSTSALLYGDVNNDGSVTLADSVALNKYLNGVVALSNYENADVNANGIIEQADADILLAYCVGIIGTLPYTS